MSPPLSTASTIDLIQDYYAQKIDVASRIKTNGDPTQHLDSLKLDGGSQKEHQTSSDTSKTEQQEQQ